MSTALIALTDMDRMAAAIAASGLFGMKRKEEALALMIVAQAEGRHPGTVAAEYHIIQGRPALKADAMLARFQAAGGSVKWLAYTDEAVSAEFTHPQGGTVSIDWSMDRAKKAGLTGKDNWTKYPRQMLRARVISEGVRTCFPAVCSGVYTPEEVRDMPPEKEINPRPRRYGKMPEPHPQDIEEDAKLRALETASPASTVAPSSSAIVPPSTPEAAGGATSPRDKTLSSLCTQARVNKLDLLAKAGVAHADEMSEQDWREAQAMLNRKISKAARAGEMAGQA